MKKFITLVVMILNFLSFSQVKKSNYDLEKEIESYVTNKISNYNLELEQIKIIKSSMQLKNQRNKNPFIQSDFDRIVYENKRKNLIDNYFKENPKVYQVLKSQSPTKLISITQREGVNENSLPQNPKQCTVNGVTITATGSTEAYCHDPSPISNNCSSTTNFAGLGAFTGNGFPGVVTYNFSTPILSATVMYTSVDFDDIGQISIDGCSPVMLSNACGAIINNTYLTCNYSPGTYGDVRVTVSSLYPFTSITLTNIGEDTGWVQGNLCTFQFSSCLAGCSAPVLSSNATINAVCPSNTYDLNNISSSNSPNVNSILTWHTGSPATLSNTVANTSNVSLGTYYASFLDTVNNCYSPTAPLTINVSICDLDLSIVKSVNISNPLVNSNVIFTLIAKNNGTVPATGVIVNDILPTGYTLVSATSSTGTWTSPNWNIGNLASGTSATLNLTYKVKCSGNFTNTATISGLQPDLLLSNNTSSALTNPIIIDAIDDDFSVFVISSCTGGNSQNVTINDKLCNSMVDTLDVTLALLNNGGLIGATINSLGIITVPANSVAGTYFLTYKICRASNLTICDTAVVKIIVKATIDAVNNDFTTTPINVFTGGVTTTVFNNDTLNGLPLNASNVTFQIINSPIPGVLTNSAGLIYIPIGTPSGTYTLTYSITQNSCATNSDTATVIIIVKEIDIMSSPIVPGIRANSSVTAIDTQSDGKIIIGGVFTAYNNVPCKQIARLKSDLTLDTTIPFVTSGPPNMPNSTAFHGIYDIVVYKNTGSNFNKILVLGSFPSFNGGTNGVGIARLNVNGDIDATFNQTYTGINKGIYSSINDPSIYSSYIYPNLLSNGQPNPNAGKIIIAGFFDRYNNVLTGCVTRLMPDGSLDTSFNSNIAPIAGSTGVIAGFNSRINTVAVQADGKILVGGWFTQFNGTPKVAIARILPSGLPDNTFNNSGFVTFATFDPLSYNQFVEKIVLQPDGKILVGGQFPKYSGVVHNNLLRLNTTGDLDTTFNPTGGGIDNVPPIPGNSLYKQLTLASVNDMILDSSTATWKLYVSVYSYHPQTGISISGPSVYYTNKFNGSPIQRVIRINCSPLAGQIVGNKNNDFNMGGTTTSNGPDGSVIKLKLQSDGKILIGGQFNNYVMTNTQTQVVQTSPASNITRIFPTVASNEAKVSSNYYSSETEIELSENELLTIYPNPSTGIFTIQMNKNDLIYDTLIYNVLGQKVYSRGVSNEYNKLDLTNLGKGTYFVSFTNENYTIKKTIIIN